MRHAPLVSLGVLLLAFSARSALASWSPDSIAGGTPVCVDPADQVAPVVGRDSYGGLYVAWVDHRGAGGSTDVYAQHFSLSGDPLWGPSGRPVCTATGDQDQLAIVGTDAGVFVVWRDFRNASNPANGSDIYAQKLDTNGDPLWAVNGIALCTAPGNQQAPITIGSLVVWTDYRADGDLYGQVVAANGSLAWEPNGRGLVTAAGEQRAPVAGVGATNDAPVWLAWEDVDAQAVFALPLTAAYAPHAGWDPQGDPVHPTSSNAESQPSFLNQAHVVDGLTRLCWVEGNSVMGALLDAGSPPSLPASTLVGGNWPKSAPHMVRSGGSAGTPLLVLEWIDHRNGHANLYVQAYDANFFRKWNPATGIAVSSGILTVGNVSPVQVDQDTTTTLVWMQKSDASGAGPNYGLSMQTISWSGFTRWPAGGHAIPGASSTPWLTAMQVSSAYPRAGTLVVWQDGRSGNADVDCNLIGVLGDLGDREPTSVRLQDAPGDGGGFVLARWNAARDTVPGGHLVLYFTGPGTNLAGGGGTAPVPGASQYSLPLATNFDHVPTIVRIVAQYSGPGGTTMWLSDTASATSFDNTPPPPPPSGSAAYTASGTSVSWSEVFPLGTVWNYNLYRGPTAAFPTDVAHRIKPFAGIAYFDAGAPPSFYKVTSFNLDGTESAPLLITPSGTTDADGAAPPLVFSVANVSPNPLARSGRVEFALPRRAVVRFSLVDPAGRVVRDWNLGLLPPGTHSQTLELGDTGRSALASGIYFLKASIPGEERARRLVVLR